MSKWTKWAIVPGYIVTADKDGRVTMNARIAARTDAGDDMGESHFARLLLEQANAALDLAEALERLTTRIHDCYSDVPRSIQVLSDEARAILARINGESQ